MRKIRVLRIVVVILSFLAGCRSGDSVVDDGAVREMPFSLVDAHYFPTGDGRGNETYEVVLRNSGAVPIELSAKRDAARRSRGP